MLSSTARPALCRVYVTTELLIRYRAMDEGIHGDSDVISLYIYVSGFSPPSCG